MRRRKSTEWKKHSGRQSSALSGLADIADSKSEGLRAYIDDAIVATKESLVNQVLIAGGNAIIGMSISPFYVEGLIGILATGTVVTIEADE